MCLYLRKGIIKHCKKFIAIFSVTTLITTGLITPDAFAANTASASSDNNGTSAAATTLSDEDIRYNAYLQKIEEEAKKAGVTVEDYKGNDIVLTPAEAVCEDEAEGSTEDNPIHVKTPLADEDGKVNVLKWTEEYSAFSWVVNVPQTGYYQISVEYISVIDGLAINPARGIKINGETPFFEAVNMPFKKWWKDESEPVINELTQDEAAPGLVEVRHWATVDLRDTDGYYAEPFKFYLEKGENKITFTNINRDIFFGNIYVTAPLELEDYATVSSRYPSADVSGTAISDRLEAEAYDRIIEKSSNMMRITASKNTTVTPFKSGYTVMNQVGGSTNWYSDRDSYTWKINVPEDGLYKIALRVANTTNIGMPVYRQIYIDGEIPFEEFKAYKFKYSYYYYTETLSDANGDPYLLYLTKGEHTLKMEVLLGDLGSLALSFYSETDNLNKLTRQIQKIIGSSPDSNYNYRLEKRVPGLMDSLNGLIDNFNSMIEILKVACDTDSSSMINDLRSAIDTLKSCVADPQKIPDKMGDIQGIQTSMGTWIKNLESSALMIDFIEVAQPQAAVSDPKMSFWNELKNVWTSFIVSFTKEYNSNSQEIESDGKDVIEIWMSKDRENADMIISLLNSEFSQGKHDFSVKIRIVPGQIEFGGFNLLLLSLMSGREPDMIWGCGATTPVQYAIRGIGYNLEQFDDFEEVTSRFSEATMQALRYTDNTNERNGTFALPETTSVNLVFYRKDIFAELGLSIPETWDEYFQVVLPAFYKEGYVPVACDAGAWLLQRGGWPTRADNRLSGYDTELAYQVQMDNFNQYLIYGIDVEVQAFQGFRNGEVPYMTGGLDIYTQLVAAAPELMGKWGIGLTMGTYDEYGILNRTNFGAGAGTAMAIMPETKYADHCWEVMKWWTSTDIQIEFSSMVDAKFGQENRYYSANVEALLSMGWTTQEREVIKESFNWYCNMQNIIGSYQMDRYGNFAFNQVVIQGKNARDAIEEMVEMINPELVRKQLQYDITPASDEEIANKVYDITAIDRVSYYRRLREEAQKAQQKG